MKTQIPMKYEIPLSKGRKIILETPIPVNEMNKKEKKKLINWIFRVVDAIYTKSKAEAIGKIGYHKSEIERLQKDYGL